MKSRMIVIGLCVALFGLSSCASNPPPQNPAYNPYTPGQVSLTLRKGVTRQAEVARVFGAPNIVTQNDDGSSVWIYQKNAVVTKAQNDQSFATILLAGNSSDTSGFAQSARTMTLVIHFTKAGVVSGFKSLTTSF